MRSANSDRFNHDEEAADYDRNVQNETDPIRAGYDELLTWVASHVPPRSEVIDLGCGTGNLAARIESPARMICVDVSEKMTSIAREKLAGCPCEFVIADLLECFARLPVVDAVASTYAIHHLDAEEKPLLFRSVWEHLRHGGKAVFGDLMFESTEAETAICDAYARTGDQELVDDIRDEFFWYLDVTTRQLGELGFEVSTRRFSELSWGVIAEKPAV